MSFLFLRNWEKLEERVGHIHSKSPIELTFAFQNKNIVEGILEPRKIICNDMSRQHVKQYYSKCIIEFVYFI